MSVLARRVLYIVRTANGPVQRLLLLLMAAVSALQVAMAWICLPVAIAARCKPVPGSNFAAFAKLRAWLGFAPLRARLCPFTRTSTVALPPAS